MPPLLHRTKYLPGPLPGDAQDSAYFGPGLTLRFQFQRLSAAFLQLYAHLLPQA